MKRPSQAELVRALPAPSAQLLEALLGAAQRTAMPIYLVGGPVRDLLLGRALRDIDLVAEADAAALQALVRDSAPGARVVAHARFGTLHVEQGGAALDLASARRERYAHDGALPLVEPGALDEDLWRRDFSVNALALPLSAAARERHAGLVDPTGGVADLEKGILRILHPRSFHDDPTRALRAARLAPRLGMTLSRGTRSGLRDALRDGAFARVSGERYRAELARVFEDARQGLDPAHALGWLDRAHVLGAFEPGLRVAPAATAPLRRLGRALTTPAWSGPVWDGLEAGLALWLAPLAPELRQRTLRRLGLRGAPARRVAGWPRLRERAARGLRAARGRGTIDALLAPLREEELIALFASSDAAARRRIARFAGEDRARRPPLDGSDLVTLGLRGPEVGRALARVRAAFLDGQVRTREEALVLAAEHGRHARRRKP